MELVVVSVTSPLTVVLIKLVSTSFTTFSLSLTPSLGLTRESDKGETVVREISTLARTVVLSSVSILVEDTMATLPSVVLWLLTRLTGLV